MKKATVARFKKVLEDEKRRLLFSDRVMREDFNADQDDRYDEVDQATSDTEQGMRMRLRNREILYLKKIQEALQRIDEESFGDCVSCGEEIETRRLTARPTATLCVSCKEEEERHEGLNASGLRSKSLGDLFSQHG